jgi:predicted DNA-binding protein
MGSISAEEKRSVYPVDLTEVKEKLDAITDKTGYNKAEAIREAIKHYAEYVQGLEVIEYKDRSKISKQETKKLIIEYMAGKNKIYSCDMADDLQIEPGYVEECLYELWKEDRIEEIVDENRKN